MRNTRYNGPNRRNGRGRNFTAKDRAQQREFSERRDRYLNDERERNYESRYPWGYPPSNRSKDYTDEFNFFNQRQDQGWRDDYERDMDREEMHQKDRRSEARDNQDEYDNDGYERGFRYRGRFEQRDEYNDHAEGQGRGWFGDPEGHSEAAERGWYNRNHRNNRENSNHGRQRGRGWFGHSRQHAEAAERGWRNREQY